MRDWDKPGNIKPYIRDLNRARRANPALQQTSNLRFLRIEDGNVIGFVKQSVDQTNSVVVAIALSRDIARILVSARRYPGARPATAATSPRSKT